MDTKRFIRTTGFTLLAVAAVAALGAILVRDQISRHRRDLFSSHPLRRLAALGYIGGSPASVELVMLLRDFVAWEQRPLLRERAKTLIARMEDSLAARARAPEAV
jgi:high-affinity Fe2+/Pb2+ permease